MKSEKSFSKNLAFARQARQELAELLSKISQTLRQAESKGKSSSENITLVELTDQIQRLDGVSQNLKEGKFKILVLGEFSRGKSTVINALLREKILPRKSNPCTAILTFVRYGQSKQVTINYNDGKLPDKISIDNFNTKYTIPDDANPEQKNIFLNVDNAVIEYPLEILKDGVEIVDSPGLNEDPTEGRDEIVFTYIKECSAILFVLDATQAWKQKERNYLENKIKGKGLPVFFLINSWDTIEKNLLDEDLAKEEERIRERCRGILSEYLTNQDDVQYKNRVFEISALNIFQAQKNPNVNLYEFPRLEKELGEFLTNERLSYELGQALNIAQTVDKKIQEIVERIIPSLKDTVEQLQKNISSVQPLFTKLENIRDSFRQNINQEKQRCSTKVAESFKSYIHSLEDTFYLDFSSYRPTLQGVSESDAEKFCQEANSAFRRYLETKIATWSRNEDSTIKKSFQDLDRQYLYYVVSYSETTQEITMEFKKDKDTSKANLNKSGDSSSLLSGNTSLGSIDQSNISQVGAVSSAVVGALQGSFLGYFAGGAAVGIAIDMGMITLPILFSGFGIPIAIGIIWGAIAGWQNAKETFIANVNSTLIKQLSEIADTQYDLIYSSVGKKFDPYLEVVDKMNNDICSQRQQLNSLLEQKKTKEIDVDNEEKRLNQLKQEITQLSQQVKESYQKYTGKSI